MEPRKGRILIADDDMRFQNVTAGILRRTGYTCDSALDAAEAQTHLKLNSYDLILADIKMPGNMNMEFINLLPHIAAGVSVIVITGFPTLEPALQRINYPVSGYLIKPFDYQVLLSQVAHWIEQPCVVHTCQCFE